MNDFNSIIETDRLFLREFIEEDIQSLEKMNSDPTVIRYTSDYGNSPEEATKRFSVMCSQYQKYGMGRWIVIRKSDEAFLGWCGLKYHPEDKIVDVGYRLCKEYWGYGYATEATKASVAYGFNVLHLKEIYAHVHPNNYSSEKVLIKCGLNFEKEIIYKNQRVKLFKRVAKNENN